MNKATQDKFDTHNQPQTKDEEHAFFFPPPAFFGLLPASPPPPVFCEQQFWALDNSSHWFLGRID